MGSRGLPPKDPSKRQRRNKPPQLEELPDPDDVEAPPLPRRPAGGRWEPAARRWYDTWARSPQAAAFGATDWGRLQMLAPVVDAYWREVRKDEPSSTVMVRLLGEIRLNEAKLGATVEDRRRLHWKLPEADQAPEAEPVPPPARKRRPSGRRDPRLRSV
jgi:hypothetical protein